MKRKPFLHRLVIGILALPLIGAIKPKSAVIHTYVDIKGYPDHSVKYRKPWPNDAPFPCIGRCDNIYFLRYPNPTLVWDGSVPECGLCRANHNRIIVKWDSERWKGVIIDPTTGMWDQWELRRVD